MQRLAAIAVDILAHLAGAADAGKHHDFMLREIQLLERILDGGMDEEVSASWTPLDLGETVSHGKSS